MRKAERGFGSGRIVAALLVSSLGVALAGCGGVDGTSSSGTTSSTSSNTVADTASTSGTTTGTGSTSGSGATSDVGATSGGGATSGTGSTSGSGSATGNGTTSGTGSAGTTPPAATAVSTSVTLGWQAPTENINGTPITDLAGYKIHYGTASADYTQTVALNNASLTRYVVDNLPSGTYYFAITAYNSMGFESPLSGEVSTTVD